MLQVSAPPARADDSRFDAERQRDCSPRALPLRYGPVHLRTPMNNPAFASEDGNFKRGAVKPIAIVIGILLVIGAGAFAFLSVHTEAQSLTKEAVNKEIQDIQLLPKAEQIPRWRKWADTENEPRLRQEALVHLAWAKDRESLPSIAKALGALDHT